MTTTFYVQDSEDASDIMDKLRDRARTAHSWDIVIRPSGPGFFSARISAARRAVARIEDQLRALSNPPGPGESAGKPHMQDLIELRKNPRLMRSTLVGVSDHRRAIAHLPRVIRFAQEEEPRAAALASLYLDTVDGDFSAQTFSAFLHEVQAQESLTLDELWSLPDFLQFAALVALVEEVRTLLESPDSLPKPFIQARIKSLRSIGKTDWISLIEPLIVFDATLRLDPTETYAAMDIESREFYRKRVAFIACHSDCTELKVAELALKLARESAANPCENLRTQCRRSHVGYYLRDKGFPLLAERIGFHPTLAARVRTFVRAQPDFFYITCIQLITVFFVAVLIVPALPHSTLFQCLIAILLLILPASQSAVDLVNNAVNAIFDPSPLAKLDFSKGIPVGCSTIVAVPTLLLNEAQVRELVTNMEVRYLANRDPNLHFALLSDLRDSVTKPRENDSDPLVELAIQLINELNVKYAAPRRGSFLFLHRSRTFNGRQGVWMGWERKRGKLLDLNKLLAGEFDAFPIKAGYLPAIKQARYVLTLDSDSQLPRGSAAKLIGAIAHPLNQAVINPQLRIVTEGYGILQPRVGVAVRSASRSRLASIYSGQNGFDIYTRAVSDAYQDLYGEGIFAGKGIYEAAVLHAVLDHRFPRNALLSHDLIEGAYARAGLASDIELIDDYPSHLSAYNRRKHRWVRGDWQIARWMFSRVPDESRHLVENPISEISRWKIFDNLRRSLVEPFTLILLVAGWLGLPGGPLYWTLVSLFLLVLPTLVQLVFGLFHALASGRKGGVSQVATGFRNSLLINLLNLVLLPRQTLLAFDAIVRALVRQFITGQRLLEWETAAEAETNSSKRTSADRYLHLASLVAVALAIAVYGLGPRPVGILCAAPILVLWGFANAVNAWLDAAPRGEQKRLSPVDDLFLQCHALRLWRFFDRFGAERHNYLIPDNVEEDGFHEAARVSPTNLGLLLNARQAAYEFGFLTLPEFVQLTDRSLSTIDRLEKFRGHLYNWYDTQTLQPLDASPFVSTVDSGNFVASLYSLHAGALDFAKRPILGPQLFKGLRVHWKMLLMHKEQTVSLRQFLLPEADAPIVEWIDWLAAAASLLTAVSGANDGDHESTWMFTEVERRIDAILSLIESYLPWMLPAYAPLCALLQVKCSRESERHSIQGAIAFAESLDLKLADVSGAMTIESSIGLAAEQLRASISSATSNLLVLASALQSIATGAERLAEATEFAFLVSPERRLLSIGYDVQSQTLHDACYDLLPSEARLATFLAVARGELSQESWFKLGREHTLAFGHFLMLSWTGTMFEYLMPGLWMHCFPDTLIARTQTASVNVQRAFARSLKTPWGISESGSSDKDDAGHYRYHAYGVPQLALSPEATAGPVVSPYAAFLALSVDSLGSLRNLRSMAGSGWVGRYGFYEAADYGPSLTKPVLVREWMAHHQGMSLLAILNLLNDNIMQRWFHANPLVQSSELILHELPVHKALLKAEWKELGETATSLSAAA